VNRKIPQIAYGPEDRQAGDLFLPEEIADHLPVLLIHGGGWDALSKEAVEPVARLFQGEGHPVFSINYRLLRQAPWPACGDDCLAAARFLQEGRLASQGLPAPAELLIAGASAGGHLAMMTGLRLPRERVRGILSLAGPSRWNPRDDPATAVTRKPGLLEAFFGGPVELDSPRVKAASPIDCVPENPPQLICVQSKNDRLVPPSHSEVAVAAWQARDGEAEARYFDGPGDLHGFWIGEEIESRQLVPEFAETLRGALAALRDPRESSVR